MASLMAWRSTAEEEVLIGQVGDEKAYRPAIAKDVLMEQRNRWNRV